MEQDETWKPTTQVLGYEVSDKGRVRHAIKKTIKGTPINAGRYPVVHLWQKNVGRVVYVHDLVAEAFVGPKQKGQTVNHIDGDKSNNVPQNLEYISLSENNLHAHKTGLMRVKGEDNGHAKLTEADVLEIRRRIASGEKQSALAVEFGVKDPIVSQIKHRTRWVHI